MPQVRRRGYCLEADGACDVFVAGATQSPRPRLKLDCRFSRGEKRESMAVNNLSLTDQPLEFECLIRNRTKRRVLCLSYILPAALGMSLALPNREHYNTVRTVRKAHRWVHNFWLHQWGCQLRFRIALKCVASEIASRIEMRDPAPRRHAVQKDDRSAISNLHRTRVRAFLIGRRIGLRQYLERGEDLPQGMQPRMIAIATALQCVVFSSGQNDGLWLGLRRTSVRGAIEWEH
ncbi:hypothetical protein HBI24_201660 [Parastagonospora nodorum]|nr:hypothetical protein HBH53_160740 [Parastagonospora nodorum]KAH4092862.1 hypothetical protein HBH48_073240 [Parastagonospora nodorum]KAH4217440.1 hypothetical protein HBI06_215880 [Parastagonospora nodorum]KAH4228875.1 hypothetical protein HBI05_198880 [Parastagonospora nodorum]KAH4287410.1 hypothetical protein HBI02_216380 [Parastagonospora nodorum]